jgi:hypothetical protein
MSSYKTDHSRCRRQPTPRLQARTHLASEKYDETHHVQYFCEGKEKLRN